MRTYPTNIIKFQYDPLTCALGNKEDTEALIPGVKTTPGFS
jgi:hypothetical protein